MRSSYERRRAGVLASSLDAEYGSGRLDWIGADPPIAEEGSICTGSLQDGDRVARVLVVDNDALLRSFLRTVLVMGGHEVREAADGVAALVQLDRWLPDVVVTDVTMPRMNGAEFVRILRSRPDTAHIRIIVTSAGPSDDVGLDAAFPKPYEVDELADTIDAMVGNTPQCSPQDYWRERDSGDDEVRGQPAVNCPADELSLCRRRCLSSSACLVAGAHGHPVGADHDWMYDWESARRALQLGLETPDEDHTVCRRCGMTERHASLDDQGCQSDSCHR
jgi:CheY-like chemotaxis protein